MSENECYSPLSTDCDLDQVGGWSDSGGQTGTYFYSYDANGNVSGTPHSVYVHDSRNRLETVGTYVREGGFDPALSGVWASMAYRYDANGRRVLAPRTIDTDLLFLQAHALAAPRRRR